MAAPEAGGPAERPTGERERRRRRRLGIVPAIAIPALTAAALVVVLTGGPAAKTPERQLPPPLAAAPAIQGDAPRLAPLPGARPAEPRRISIPRIGISAPIESVGLQRGGILRVPDVGRAGWFDGGPRPGEVGRSVVIGHLDTNRGPALFARVPQLGRGTMVEIADREGDVHRYRITGRRQVAKRRFPTSEVYGRAGEPVLVLITCGGEFVPGRGYEDNVLVYARAA